MMYDELIGELYLTASTAQSKSKRELLEKAADAIGELSHDYEKLAEDFNGAMELLHKRKKPRWIPVTERLPEPEGHSEYIVCVKHFNPEYTRNVLVTTAEFEARLIECGDGPYWVGHNDGITRVTHWMPFPEPPKEGET